MAWELGETINSPLRMRRLSGSIPTSYTVFKYGDYYYAECNIPGGTAVDPSTDAATVIQAVIDAINSGSDTGGNVFIKRTSSNYMLSATLTMKEKVDIISNRAWLETEDNVTPAIKFEESSPTTFNSTIQGLHVEGGSRTGCNEGIELKNVNNGITFIDVEVAGFLQRNVGFHESVWGVNWFGGKIYSGTLYGVQTNYTGNGINFNHFWGTTFLSNDIDVYIHGDAFFNSFVGCNFSGADKGVCVIGDGTKYPVGNGFIECWFERSAIVANKIGIWMYDDGTGASLPLLTKIDHCHFGNYSPCIKPEYCDHTRIIDPYFGDAGAAIHSIVLSAGAIETRIIDGHWGTNVNAISDSGTRTKFGSVGEEAAGVGNPPTAANWDYGDIVENTDDNKVYVKQKDAAFVQIA